ncbi:MAG: hypothetical protein AABY46_01070 [Nitrospirota bacterium]
MPVNLTVYDLDVYEVEKKRPANGEAIAFVRSQLDGTTLFSNELNRRGRLAGISPRSIERARQKLGTISERLHGPTGQWSVRLPIVKLRAPQGK